MPAPKTAGVIGATAIVAALAGTVILNRTRPSQPPPAPVTVTLPTLHPFRPNICEPIDEATARRWAKTPGYEWIATRCDLVHIWRTTAPTIPSDLWLCDNSYDAPSAQMDVRATLREVAKGPLLLLDYHGRTYSAKVAPLLKTQDVTFRLPCYADGGAAATNFRFGGAYESLTFTPTTTGWTIQ